MNSFVQVWCTKRHRTWSTVLVQTAEEEKRGQLLWGWAETEWTLNNEWLRHRSLSPHHLCHYLIASHSKHNAHSLMHILASESFQTSLASRDLLDPESSSSPSKMQCESCSILKGWRQTLVKVLKRAKIIHKPDSSIVSDCEYEGQTSEVSKTKNCKPSTQRVWED